MSNTTDFVRMNITLPQDLVMVLKTNVEPRGISKFLAEAAREKIEESEKEKALKALLAAPATFRNIRNSTKYIRKIRGAEEKRARRFLI